MVCKFWSGAGVLASIVAGAGAASAGDLPVNAPAYKAPPVILSDWAGFYLGVNGGYGLTNTIVPFAIFDNALNSFVAQNLAPNQKGGLFGGHAGYNWQYGSVVTGLEVDFDGADINGTNNISNVSPPLTLKTTELASARARLGYLVLPNLLAYSTAGAGLGHTDIAPETPIIGFSGFGVSQFGWTAGAGLEYKLWDHWIARAEYLHYDFQQTDTNIFISSTVTEKIDVVRGGLSYKF
jgi:opacity protein-like surface antigen